MTLNTREVDQKFQIYSVIFPFLLVFLWVPTNWGFEKQKILGTSSSFGRPGDAPLEHPRIGPGGSFGELALLYFAPRAATVEVGVVSVGPVGFFWNRGGKPVVVLGSPNIHRNGPSPKKGGSKILKFLEKLYERFLMIFWIFWVFAGFWLNFVFLFKMDPLQAADDSSVWIIDRGSIWRWPWTEDLGMAMEASSQTFITFTHSCGKITFVVPGCQKLPFGKLPGRSRWNFTRQLQENYVKVLWWTRGWVSQTPGQGDILTLLVWCVKIAIFVDADFSQPFWGCFKQKLQVERCCA